MMIEIIPNWHPVFVHFTVALLTVSLGLFVTTLFVKCEQAMLVAKWNLWIGSGISVLTLAAGYYAYNTVAHDTPSHEAMTEHRNIALITLALLVPVVIWSVMAHRKAKTLGVGFVALFLVVGGLLASTAWHGGEVVYRYGLGVMSMPDMDNHDHAAHSEGGEHGHGDTLDDHHDGGHGHDSLSEDNHHGSEATQLDGQAGTVHLHEDGSSHVHSADKKTDHAEETKSDHHDDGHDHAH